VVKLLVVIGGKVYGIGMVMERVYGSDMGDRELYRPGRVVRDTESWVVTIGTGRMDFILKHRDIIVELVGYGVIVIQGDTICVRWVKVGEFKGW
jgi:hypothetical protein